MVCGCRPVRTAARKNLDVAAGYPVAALVLQVRVVPAVVVEIRVVVGDLVAVQPVDLHTGPGGAGVVPGVRGIRAAHRPETVLVGPDRRMPRRRPALHEAVVVGDVRRGCVARGRGHEQQPELAARAHPGRGERPVVRHPDLVRAGRRRHQRQCRRRIRLVPRLRPQRRMAQACYGPVVGRPDRPAVERNPPAARPPAAERDPVGVEVASLHGVVEIQHIRRRADRPGINRPAPNPADVKQDVGPPGHQHRLVHRKAHRHGLPRAVGRSARRRRRNRRRRRTRIPGNRLRWRYRRAHAVHLVRRVVDPAVAQNHRLALRRGEDRAAGGNRQPVRLDRDAVRVLLALGDRVFEALHRARRLAGLPARLAVGAADLQRQGGRAAGHGHGHRVREGHVDPDRVADPVGLRGPGEGDVTDDRTFGEDVAHPEPGEAVGQVAAPIADPALRRGVVREVGERHDPVGVDRRFEGQDHLPSHHLDRARRHRLDVAPHPRHAHHREIDLTLARVRGRGRLGLEVLAVGQRQCRAVHHRADRHRRHPRRADMDGNGGGAGNGPCCINHRTSAEYPYP